MHVTATDKTTLGLPESSPAARTATLLATLAKQAPFAPAPAAIGDPRRRPLSSKLMVTLTVVLAAMPSAHAPNCPGFGIPWMSLRAILLPAASTLATEHVSGAAIGAVGAGGVVVAAVGVVGAGAVVLTAAAGAVVALELVGTGSLRWALGA